MNTNPTVEIYRTINQTDLGMHIFPSEDSKSTGIGLLGFYGGGWQSGKPEAWYHIARFMNQHGITVFLPQYRLMPVHKVNLWEIIEDAHLAYEWVINNASNYGVDSKKVGIGGGSAGGFLAATSFLILPKTRTSFLPEPKFYIGGNPVLDTSINGFGNDIIGSDWEMLSPLHILDKKIPPSIIFHGTADKTTPIEGIRKYQQKVQQFGGTCVLHEYDGREHAFFNKQPDFQDIFTKAKDFIFEQTINHSEN
jgi:acetyl esterase/lipase